MDTFHMIIAALIGFSIMALMIVSYFYLDRTQAGIKDTTQNSKERETKETTLEDSKDDTTESKEEGKGLSSEDMMKCPFSYFEHIPSEVKRTEHEKIKKTIEEDMTVSEKEREREVQRQQMQEIFKLMQGQEETFGISNMSEMQDQLKMYSPNI